MAILKEITTLDRNLTKIYVTFSDYVKAVVSWRGLNKKLYSDITLEDAGVINLEYIANCGNLTNLPYSNKIVYEDVCFNKLEKQIEKVSAALKVIKGYNGKVNFELVVSSNSVEDLTNLHFFAKEFYGVKNVYVNYVALKNKSEDNFGAQYPVLNVYKRVELTAELISEFTTTWQKLVLNNSAVIGINDGNLIGRTLKNAQNDVITLLTNRYTKISTIHKKMELKKGKNYCSYTAFNYVLKTLIDENLVEKTCSVSYNSNCIDTDFEQKFKLTKKGVLYVKNIEN